MIRTCNLRHLGVHALHKPGPKVHLHASNLQQSYLFRSLENAAMQAPDFTRPRRFTAVNKHPFHRVDMSYDIPKATLRCSCDEIDVYIALMQPDCHPQKVLGKSSSSDL